MFRYQWFLSGIRLCNSLHIRRFPRQTQLWLDAWWASSGRAQLKKCQLWLKRNRTLLGRCGETTHMKSLYLGLTVLRTPCKFSTSTICETKHLFTKSCAYCDDISIDSFSLNFSRKSSRARLKSMAGPIHKWSAKPDASKLGIHTLYYLFIIKIVGKVIFKIIFVWMLKVQKSFRENLATINQSFYI